MHFNVQLINYKIYNKNAAFLLLCGGKRSRGLGTSPQNIKTKIDKLKVFKYIISFFIQLFPAAKSFYPTGTLRESASVLALYIWNM
ncbi:hypothetical protein [Brachyspira pilosicoli]|uniref:Uncharacterized protein n=1 Tax=Brachyspira pilosicoli TaxID=52584 RepID=A0A5C8EXD8_BRAPL|nr:hypothetical protein [Brachyspira pilosicoli]TXJ42133.1 hypothetical protein EPJ72_05845 [Brachyspira pilosicoli]